MLQQTTQQTVSPRKVRNAARLNYSSPRACCSRSLYSLYILRRGVRRVARAPVRVYTPERWIARESLRPPPSRPSLGREQRNECLERCMHTLSFVHPRPLFFRTWVLYDSLLHAKSTRENTHTSCVFLSLFILLFIGQSVKRDRC
ncbi:unnamed protein product [Ectocarpus sp. 8 AP-2014]